MDDLARCARHQLADPERRPSRSVAAERAFSKSPWLSDGIVNLAGPRPPFCGPCSVRAASTTGEQGTCRPEPPRHRHNEHAAAVYLDNAFRADRTGDPRYYEAFHGQEK